MRNFCCVQSMLKMHEQRASGTRLRGIRIFCARATAKKQISQLDKVGMLGVERPCQSNDAAGFWPKSLLIGPIEEELDPIQDFVTRKEAGIWVNPPFAVSHGGHQK
jgi:hypothetical protein